MKINYDLDIDVNEDVYRPSDDTYLLIELLDLDGDERVLDMGCGSGAIALHCADNGNETTAVDISTEALNLTKKNSLKNDLDMRLVRSDLFSELDDRWDVVIFNPPYLPEKDETEFDSRWDGGPRGDETILRFLNSVDEYLNKPGYLYFIYSDKAPVSRVEEIIQERYTLENRISETFDFETIYAVKLKRE